VDSLIRALERLLLAVCALAFAGLIGVVFVQVFARNLLEMSVIWTLDVAQMLFSWCVYLGAAVGVKWGAHFALDLFPESMRRTNAALKVFADLALAAVAVLVAWGGWNYAFIDPSRSSAALGISEAYFVAPIPIAAICMVVFITSTLTADIRAFVTAQKECR